MSGGDAGKSIAPFFDEIIKVIAVKRAEMIAHRGVHILERVHQELIGFLTVAEGVCRNGHVRARAEGVKIDHFQLFLAKDHQEILRFKELERVSGDIGKFAVGELSFVENGTVSERGTHEELLKQRGYYWQTYCLQYGIPMEEVG